MLLVVDDDTLTIRALKRVFATSEGACNGEEAKKLTAMFHPWVILLDVNLDGESGLELLAELLKLSPESKVIVFTAKTTNERRRQAYEAGAIAYVDKMHISRIREIVTDIISKDLQVSPRSLLH